MIVSFGMIARKPTFWIGAVDSGRNGLLLSTGGARGYKVFLLARTAASSRATRFPAVLIPLSFCARRPNRKGRQIQTPTVNVSVSSSPATARCLISTVSLRSVFGTRNGNGGNNPPVGECETCIDRLTKQPKKGWSGTPDVLIGKTDHLPWYERLLIVVVWDLLNMPRSERVLAALAWAVLCLAVLFIVYHH